MRDDRKGACPQHKCVHFSQLHIQLRAHVNSKIDALWRLVRDFISPSHHQQKHNKYFLRALAPRDRQKQPALFANYQNPLAQHHLAAVRELSFKTQ
jgi:hypothetical protein